MKRRLLLAALMSCFYLSISAATYYVIDTTSPLHCYLSSQFQNRIMVENGRIQKVIATESERLSIQIEELTGQAFIFARDPNAKETSISVVSDSGVVQDIHICFMERMSEVVVLQEPDIKDSRFCEQQDEKRVENSFVLKQIEEILAGNIPRGYSSCSMYVKKWIPKKGIELEPKRILEGPEDIIYVYQATNVSKQQQTVLECELECQGSQWVYLETNALNPKQKITCMISLRKYE